MLEHWELRSRDGAEGEAPLQALPNVKVVRRRPRHPPEILLPRSNCFAPPQRTFCFGNTVCNILQLLISDGLFGWLQKNLLNNLQHTATLKWESSIQNNHSWQVSPNQSEGTNPFEKLWIYSAACTIEVYVQRNAGSFRISRTPHSLTPKA